MRLALFLSALVVLSACSEPAGPPATPPEGWVEAGDTRWYLPGTDTTAAFRDLTTIEAMGVDRNDTEFIRWMQEQMTDIYRTAPEVVDSVFAADFLAEVRAGVPEGADYQTAAAGLKNRIKRDIFNRFYPAQYTPTTPFVIPDSLQGTTGRIAVQVYVNDEKQPVAVKLVEGTQTALDQLFMRRALDSEYTDAWVRKTAGRRAAGTNIYSWAHVSTDVTDPAASAE